MDFQRSVKGFDKEFDKETGGDRGRQQGDRGRQRKTKGDPPSQHKKNRKIENIFILFSIFFYLYF